MPLISNFYGILIRMYFNDQEKHHTPHFHASYGEYQIAVDFSGDILAGEMPAAKMKLIVAWTEIHKEDLLALWDLMQQGNEYFKIEGLK
ncbi:MAG: DUF4160 domain-containing protein [Hespellia sp.]|nr:DUF4160 domain-containing protein [Hespellia sp.]